MIIHHLHRTEGALLPVVYFEWFSRDSLERYAVFLSVGRAVSRARVCLWSPRRSPDPDRPAGPSRPCLTRARAPPSVALQATTVSLATRPRRGAEHRVRVCRTGAACPRAAPHGAAAQRAGGTPRGPTTRDARGGAPAAAAAAAASCSQTQKTRRARTGSARLARAAPRANRPERVEKSAASYNHPREGPTWGERTERKETIRRINVPDCVERVEPRAGRMDSPSLVGATPDGHQQSNEREGGGVTTVYTGERRRIQRDPAASRRVEAPPTYDAQAPPRPRRHTAHPLRPLPHPPASSPSPTFRRPPCSPPPSLFSFLALPPSL